MLLALANSNKQPLANQTNEAQDPSALRRSILETTLKGNVEVQTNQQKLEQQGGLLRKSLRSARDISTGTVGTSQRVESLIEEIRLSKTQRLLRCCCPCLASCGFCGPKRKVSAEPNRDRQPSREDDNLRNADDEEEEHNEISDMQVRLERLKKLLRDDSSWKKTIGSALYEPNPRERRKRDNVDLWHRQMDVGLAQLHQLAEDMQETLDEQTRLANMLAIYLSHGTDQVIATNKRLIDEHQILA